MKVVNVEQTKDVRGGGLGAMVIGAITLFTIISSAVSGSKS
ncbi:hypothetical protein [Vibrio crassostreae]|nr:hypothetical protein [Vibrio crassostreae]CAK3511549.1 hypothetical protein VCRA2121O334_40292 [Vibrio crassostreae]CAK3517889.1 hypothetical protein VCRA2122O341_30026 [Vibrio crassostreae]CAK3913936.1 hypothetical protein VCRA2120O333_40067 [Vibrio crassostreae]